MVLSCSVVTFARNFVNSQSHDYEDSLVPYSARWVERYLTLSAVVCSVIDSVARSAPVMAVVVVVHIAYLDLSATHQRQHFVVDWAISLEFVSLA